jgi:hypothetical protein
VCIIDKYVEVLEEILAEHTLNVQVDGMEPSEVINEHLLVGDGLGADFEQVQLRVRGRLERSDACDHGCSPRLQMKLRDQGEVDRRDLRSGIQKKVVGP